jgi:YHS domain-containing protein
MSRTYGSIQDEENRRLLAIREKEEYMGYGNSQNTRSSNNNYQNRRGLNLSIIFGDTANEGSDEKTEHNSSGLTIFGIQFQKALPFLIAAKVIIVGTILIAYYIRHKYTSYYNKIEAAVEAAEEVCHSCPNLIIRANCSDHRYPVLGGLDVVEYFSFTNESQIGSAGSEEYQSKYNQYIYYFLNEENRQLFESDPEAYAPQFGGIASHHRMTIYIFVIFALYLLLHAGFCSWGVAGEYCPKYFWTADCLGPSGNWGIWTIFKSKLYFFD